MKKTTFKTLALCFGVLAMFGCEKEELMDGDFSELSKNNIQAESCYTIDFEQFKEDNPEDLPFIDEVTGAYGTVGVYNIARNEAGEWQETNVARIYDAANPTGDDAHDLGQPKELGAMLIANQYTEAEIAANPDQVDGPYNGRIAGPNDNAWGAKMNLDFSQIEGSVTMESIVVVDVDKQDTESQSYVELTTRDGATTRFPLLAYPEEGYPQVIDLKNTENVVKLQVVLDGVGNKGSGAIDNIKFCVKKDTPPAEPYGCTLTQGYWKTHASGKKYDATWDGMQKDTFYGSGQTYLEVLQTSPKGGNAYYILAHQFIAAKLNMKKASSTEAVTAAFENAQDYFAATQGGSYSNTPQSPYTTVAKEKLVAWAGTLADYNEGKTGPGHCN